MHRIIGERGSGKTSQLLTLAHENNGIIVCSNPGAMAAKASAYGMPEGIEFYSYNQFASRFYPKNEKPIYIDEIEMFLKSMQLGDIEGYTLSQED